MTSVTTLVHRTTTETLVAVACDCIEQNDKRLYATIVRELRERLDARAFARINEKLIERGGATCQ